MLNKNRTTLSKIIQEITKRRGIKLSYKSCNTFIDTYEQYIKNDKRIHHSKLYTIKKMNLALNLFEKDTSRNHCDIAGYEKCQGYILTKDGKDFIHEIIKQIIMNEANITKDELKYGDKFLMHFDAINIDENLESIINTVQMQSIEGQINEKIVIFNNKIEHYKNNGREYTTFSRMKKELRKLSNTPYENDLHTSVYNIAWSLFNMVHPEWKQIKPEPEMEQLYEDFGYKYPGSTKLPDGVFEGLLHIKRYREQTQEMRRKLSEDLGVSIKDAKTIFTGLMNGLDVFDYKNKMLNQMSRASKYMRNEILNAIEEGNLKDFIDARQKKDTKAIKFHFLVEFYERFITNIMKEYLYEKYPNIEINRVHDALYTNIMLTKTDATMMKYFVKERLNIDIEVDI